DPPHDPKGWLVTVAWRKFLDAARADTSRRRREVRIEGEPLPRPVEAVDDTLQLYFLCAQPSLTPASSVALTLRAVGGLTASDRAGLPRAGGDHGPADQPGHSGPSRASGSTSPVTSPRCCACSTWSSTRATPATSTSRRSGSLANWRPRSTMRRWRA